MVIIQRRSYSQAVVMSTLVLLSAGTLLFVPGGGKSEAAADRISLLNTLLVVKDGNGNLVDPPYGFGGEWGGSTDLSLYHPMESRFTAIMVPKGGTFQPPSGRYVGTTLPNPSPAPSPPPGITWVHLSSSSGDLPVPGDSTQQTASLILDVDGDGWNDFVIGSRRAAPSMVWYRRGATGWTRYIIDEATLPIEAGGAFHDIDADGDLDIVMGGDSSSNKVWWWENPSPDYAPSMPWARREIKNSGASKHHDQIFGDFDGDGSAELVFWNQGAKKLFLAEIPSNPRNAGPWQATEIYSWSSGSEHEGLAAIDIDGDGVLDIVGGGRWFKHQAGTSFRAEVVDAGQRFTRAVAGQLKAGGRPEVAFVVGDGTGRLKWYEWTGSAWVGHDLLDADVDHGHSLALADVNGDGHQDVFCAEMRLNGGNADARMWLFLGDGKGGFTKTEIASGYGNHESKVGDLDGDGDLDVLGKPYNWDAPRVDVWLNDSGSPPLDRWQRHVVDASKPWKAVFITNGDLDGDGRQDILTGGWWYRNPGSPGGPWERLTVGAPLNNLAAVYDFDGDGDLDVLGTQGKGSTASDSFVWARNDGTGTFTVLSDVEAGDGDFLQGVAVGRFQPDGPLEVALSWHAAGKGVQMLRVPVNPSSETWSWRRISSAAQDEALSAGDIDRDGDLDLLLGTQWLRNDGVSWSVQPLNASGGDPDRNRLADVNGDGRLDAVVGFEAVSALGKLAWYEQPVSATGTWTEHLIAQVIGPMSLDVGDLDQDGDVDVVVGEHNLTDPSSAGLFVFENASGEGSVWRKHMVYIGDEHHDGAQLADIDGDGDLDILSIGWGHGRVLLYENLRVDGSTGPAPVFADVPETHPYHAEIEALYRAGYTAGCGTDPLRYCPDRAMTRAEGAVFVERGVHTVEVDPPQPTEQVFTDVALEAWHARWASALYEDGYTAGCGIDPLRYCPDQGHTRAEGAVFYLRMLRGVDYIPEQAKGIFVDVPEGVWYARWAEAAYGAGLIPACEQAPLRFCPEDPLTRGLAAYIMVQAKGLSAP